MFLSILLHLTKYHCAKFQVKVLSRFQATLVSDGCRHGWTSYEFRTPHTKAGGAYKAVTGSIAKNAPINAITSQFLKVGL